MNNKLLFLIVSAACFLLLGVLSTNFVRFDKQNAAMGQVMPNEHPLDTVVYESSNNSKSAGAGSTMGYINTTAYWHGNGRIYAFIKIEDGVKHASDIKKLVRSAVNGNSSASNEKNYTGWNVLTDSVLRSHDKRMSLLLTDQEKNANIIITFTNKADDAGHNAYGRTIMKLDRNDRTSLSSVQIFIFKTNQLYDRNILKPVITHEIGHAFGLQHSTSQKSIMYPKIVVMDNKPVGTIEQCEFNAINNMYIESQVGKVPCENIPPWAEYVP